MGGRSSSFSRWRHARPFWGGLFVTLAGAEILVTVKAPLPVIIHVGMQGLAGYLVPMVLLLCGILLIFNPDQRLFYSLIAAGLTLASWVTSNLGGFFFGLLLGLIGSSLAFAWSPDRIRRRRGEKRARGKKGAPPQGGATQPEQAGADDSPAWSGAAGTRRDQDALAPSEHNGFRPKHSADDQPTEALPIDAQPIDAQPADAQSADDQSADAGLSQPDSPVQAVEPDDGLLDGRGRGHRLR
jgi:hypothetical protein